MPESDNVPLTRSRQLMARSKATIAETRDLITESGRILEQTQRIMHESGRVLAIWHQAEREIYMQRHKMTDVDTHHR